LTRDPGRVAWAREVDQILVTLASDEQSFIRLSYFKGFDHARIAESAGVSPTLVSQTIAGGMQRLGRALELSPRPNQPPVRHAAIEHPAAGPGGPELGLGG
jgi:DNA-directed RNA polymerase specialized sigma24 family protein